MPLTWHPPPLPTPQVLGKAGHVANARPPRTLFSCVPNIIRILSSAAATIQGKHFTG